MAIQNTRFTPARRGPDLGDGAGGTSDRPAVRERDPVLRNVGWRTEDIRLTAGGTDMSAGNAAVYNFGQVDKMSVGRYLFRGQSAASATAEPLGAVEFHELEIREESAGVFKIDSVLDLEGLIAVGDDVQERTSQAASVYQTDKDTPVFTTTNGDSLITWSVLTSTTAATLAGLGATYIGGTPSAGDLVMVECRSTATEVWNVTRID
jgi:hypothetical protein